MDILKILSRGTKQTSRSPSTATGAFPSLPSAGSKPNPQLYNDVASDQRGQKRKRGPEQAEGDHEPTDKLPEADIPNPQPTLSETTTATNKLSEDECRQLLRSHRLKVTLLSEDLAKVEDEEVTSSKKSKKKKQKQAEPSTTTAKASDARKQLFPQPLTSFNELRTAYNISAQLADNLAQQSFKLPTEVQMASLPLLLNPEAALSGYKLDNGVDFLAVAPTGSGKTISFLIPAIQSAIQRQAQNQEPNSDKHVLESIVVAPTRELAFQIANEGRKLALKTGVKIMLMRKDTQLAAVKEEKIDATVLDEADDEDDKAEPALESEDDGEEDEEQQEASDEDDEEDADEEEEEEGDTKNIKSRGKKKKKLTQQTISKTDIIVTTPLLLLNYLNSASKTTHRSLPTVRSLILDEADVLLDPIFREHTIGIWTACTHPLMRLSLWSATMGSNIESLVTSTIVSQRRDTPPAPLLRLVVGLKDTAVPNIAHKLIYTASEQGKLLAIRQLIHPSSSHSQTSAPLRPPFIVFTQTIDRAAALQSELKYDIPLEAGGSTRIAALHSGLSPAARAATMRRFRAGEIWILITTDVLARGVDFAGVNGVVNFDVPGSSAAYVHRAGRTGRAGRAGGVAVTFYTKEDIPFVKSVANVIAASDKQAGKTGTQDAGVHQWLLDALPNVKKADRKILKERGVEERRSTSRKAKITTQSGWDRHKENNKKGAIEANKRRRLELRAAGVSRDASNDQVEWGGFDD